jgi:molecular chaperone GrpE
VGQPFDPSTQEAVATIAATAGQPAGTVVGLVRPGYLIGDDVLRAAQVAVAG